MIQTQKTTAERDRPVRLTRSGKRTLDRMTGAFGGLERVLRTRLLVYAEIAAGESLSAKIAEFIAVAVCGLAVFGLVAGLSGGRIGHALLSACKLSLVVIGSGLICLPTLYYFSILFGSPLRFLQTVTLILMAQSVSAVLLLGFAPISLLFLISQAPPFFLAALDIAMLGLASAVGLIFLIQGVLYLQESPSPERVSFVQWVVMLIKGNVRSLVLAAWLLVYAAVGTQLSWALRPFFGVGLEGGGFWSSVANLILTLVGA
jgi:uncharacterized protein (DUF486 family)